MRKIASEIDSHYPEMKSAFNQLLFHEKSSVRGWVAHHLFEVMNYDDEYRKNALKEIAYIAAHDNTTHGLGNKMWPNGLNNTQTIRIYCNFTLFTCNSLQM